jgi:hypothetical protein
MVDDARAVETAYQALLDTRDQQPPLAGSQRDDRDAFDQNQSTGGGQEHQRCPQMEVL